MTWLKIQMFLVHFAFATANTLSVSVIAFNVSSSVTTDGSQRNDNNYSVVLTTVRERRPENIAT